MFFLFRLVFITLDFNSLLQVTQGLKKTQCSYGVHDCRDVQDHGFTTSGVYHVTPIGTYNRGFDVYCDMETDGGGWLVFQRRKDGSVDFTRNWTDYQFGFGNVTDEHWLGNQLIYMIVKQGFYELRVDLKDWEGNTAYAKYSIFYIGNSTENYSLTVSGYSGDAGDSMNKSNGAQFATKDRDITSLNCTANYHAGWWFNDCFHALPNGLYVDGGNLTKYGRGIIWLHWKGTFYYSLKGTEMKMRRK